MVAMQSNDICRGGGAGGRVEINRDRVSLRVLLQHT